mgnify:CR=1 FL=1
MSAMEYSPTKKSLFARRFSMILSAAQPPSRFEANSAVFSRESGLCWSQKREVAMNGPLLAEYMEREGIDLLKIVPSHLDALLQTTEHPVRLIPAKRLILGGEPCSWGLIDRVRSMSPECVVINHYGPTETTVGVSTLRLTEMSQRLSEVPPIGRPLANVSLHVLDERLALMPIGTPGELYVGGSQVARGYLNNESDTAARFIRSPFGEGRLYRTGDRARVLSNGTLQLLARTDHQIKLRGYRIELGEIEAKLSEIEGVREAVVLAREDTPGDKRLVAYFTASYPPDAGGVSAGAPPRAEVLRQRLASQLPEYMVPAAFVAMQALPLTPNGKIDRKALPEPDARAYASKAYEAPAGEAESALASIWSEVLGIERIGRRDNFFALGGHSLMAVRVASRVQRRLGIELELGEFFDKPELMALAAVLQSAARSDLPAIERVPREQLLALSFAQQRLWFLAQIEGVSQAYHIGMGMRLVGRLDPSALRRALERIVQRHEALRTTFMARDGKPTQHIARPDIGFALQHHDLREHAGAAQELQRLSEQEARTGFDLQTGPLIRGRLVQTGGSEHVLILSMHHIVSDGWSRGVLSAELSALYSAFCQGQDDPLPALQIQYPDFAAWQRRWLSGAVLHTQSQYWQRTLLGAPELIELPTDRPRPPRQDHAGAAIEFEFDDALSAQLKALGQRHGATLFMTLLAAWGAVLVRLSGQIEVVIGTPVANRRRSELEPMIGFFVNTLALRLDSTGSPSVAQWLERVRAQALGAQQHQDLPFEQVVELMRPVRSLKHSPLFQVMFAWEGQQPPAPELPGLQLQPVQLENNVAKFDLTLTLREQGGRIGGELGYASALFDKSSIERHVEYLRCIAGSMVADQAQPIDRLQILPEAERHKLLVQWNDTKVDDPEPRCVHELFEAKAARAPDAVALRQGERQLSYGELNARANQLAHHLRAMGLKPDDRVAVVVQRSVEMVVALLATLKAGGAYVPLDPTYPAQRLAYMLDDSAPQLILTQGGVWAGVQQRWGAADAACAGNTPVLDLDHGGSNVIGDRAFHRDARVASLLAKSLMHGLLLAGVANCGKHFPGHGFVKADSHVEIPVDKRSLKALLADDVRPYEWLSTSLTSVMPAHVVYPKVDSRPAGFSPRWLNEILRQQLGFTGAIFSDDLSMAGARSLNGRELSYAEAAALALAAGCDMVLLCNQSVDGGEAVDALLDGLVWALEASQWQKDADSEARRCSLLPRTAPLAWDELMHNPQYQRALERLP